MFDIIVAQNSRYFKEWEDLYPWAKQSSSLPETINYWYIPENVCPLQDFEFPKINQEDLQFKNTFISTNGFIELLNLNFRYEKQHFVELAITKSTLLDAFFLSSKEPNWELNFNRIKHYIPHLQLVEGVKGFYEAHKTCSEKSLTFQFWVFDADCYLLEDPLPYEPEKHDSRYLHLFYALNPLNGLIYGHGGIKIFNKNHLAKNKMMNDLTLSIGELKINEKCLSVHYFSYSDYEIWRTSLRECYKLRQNFDLESQTRLKIWANTDNKFAKLGYLDSLKFNLDINDSKQVKEYFIGKRK